MSEKKQTDCVLFINEDMARLIVAWQRSIDDMGTSSDIVFLSEINTNYSPKYLSEIVGVSIGQIKTMIKTAISVGILLDRGETSELATKCVNAIISKKVAEFKN